MIWVAYDAKQSRVSGRRGGGERKIEMKSEKKALLTSACEATVKRYTDHVLLGARFKRLGPIVYLINRFDICVMCICASVARVNVA
jgi:hypothetical protein